MAKNKHVVSAPKESVTEADLCPEVEGERTVPLGESETVLREDAIRSAAYALYEARKGVGGSEEDDWLQAEAQIAQVASSGV